MIDLKKVSGLPISLDGEIIKCLDDFELPKPSFRKLEEYKDVLMPNSSLTGPEIGYLMFRNVAKPEDKEKFTKNNLTYDITVVLSGTVGQEFIKTIGHYHPAKEGTNVTYPEVYEVIYGKAHYLIQKIEDNKVIDVKIIEAKEGDKVLIPPGYGHITINPEQKTLVESNIRANFENFYQPFAKLQGACFYELSNQTWVKNKKYDNSFEPKLIKPADFEDKLGLNSSLSLYNQTTPSLEKFDFLVNPEKYTEIFNELY